MFNIGIIGCGKISQVRHIPEYAQNPDARLAGFFDLNKERAQELAVRYGVEIQYDEASATPYFFYQPEDGVVHEVWFEDARSTQAKLLLIEEYGLRGVGYWNDMRSFVQGFSVQNAMYTLERL